MANELAFSRRRFLKTAAGAGALAAVPYFVPASALGKNGAVPPSEKILVGGIGIQHRGMHDLQLDHGQRRTCSSSPSATCRRSSVWRSRTFVDNHYGNTDCAMYPEIRGSWQNGRTSTPC